MLAGYELEAPLGRGAMGTVHRARRLDDPERIVAVKRVPISGDPQLSAHLRAEAEVLAALDHPNIVRIFELVPDGDGVAIAMQYASKGSLADALAGGALDASRVAALGAKVAGALASAHRQGILHLDVKPSNVLLTGDDEPLLSDFGLARWVARPSLWGGSVLGTAEYLDPAVADGARPDERSDVYSLGVVLYELLAGRPPFSAATPLAVLRLADRGAAPDLAALAPDAPGELVAAVQRAMARQPAARFPSTAALTAALHESTGAAGGSGSPRPVRAARACVPTSTAERPTRRFGPAPPAPGLAPRCPRQWPARLAAVAAAVVVASAGVGIMRRTSAAAAPSCQAGAPVVAPDGATVLRADVHGDGCPVPVVWTSPVATWGGTRYALGRPGDVLVLGRWSCHGAAAPALYRPATGEVFRWRSWATGAAPLPTAAVEATGVPGGRPVVAHRSGCDRVVVVPGPQPGGSRPAARP